MNGSAIPSLFPKKKNSDRDPGLPGDREQIPLNTNAPAQQGPREDKNGGPDLAIVHLVERLKENMQDAKRYLEQSQSMRVAQAAAMMAADGDRFSLRVLARIARCVEQAGRAGDNAALRDLLPELENEVERNCISLLKV